MQTVASKFLKTFVETEMSVSITVEKDSYTGENLGIEVTLNANHKDRFIGDMFAGTYIIDDTPNIKNAISKGLKKIDADKGIIRRKIDTSLTDSEFKQLAKRFLDIVIAHKADLLIEDWDQETEGPYSERTGITLEFMSNTENSAFSASADSYNHIYATLQELVDKVEKST